MASGSNFISLPDSNQYDGVSGRSVSTDANSIPSGGTVVNGVRFLWEIPEEGGTGGFTGTSWFTNITGSPTNYWEFANDEAVYEYLTNPNGPGNLDAVFERWDKFLDEQGNNWTSYYYPFAGAVPGECQQRF